MSCHLTLSVPSLGRNIVQSQNNVSCQPQARHETLHSIAFNAHELYHSDLDTVCIETSTTAIPKHNPSYPTSIDCSEDKKNCLNKMCIQNQGGGIEEMKILIRYPKCTTFAQETVCVGSKDSSSLT